MEPGIGEPESSAEPRLYESVRKSGAVIDAVRIAPCSAPRSRVKAANSLSSLSKT